MLKPKELLAKKEIIILKNKFYKIIRSFFKDNNFLEVETPVILKYPSAEAYIEPFETNIKTITKDITSAYLRVSPEIQLKKLLAAGYDKIFEIAKTFRNCEPLDSPHHNHEFTLLEWYRKDSGYNKIMSDTKELISLLVKNINQNLKIPFMNKIIDFNNWQTITISKLFKEHIDINLKALNNWEELIKVAENHNINNITSIDDAYFKLFITYIEPHLNKDFPIFVTEYPSFQSAFSIPDPTDHRFCQRFELYIAGIELANGYSELTDPILQKEKFDEFQYIRKKEGQKPLTPDPEFIDSLANIDSAGGVALGLERLFMILANKKSIDETILFPVKDIL